jgi:peptidase E
MEQGILYVGKSAGAIVTGQTIATALWKGWDDPTVVEGLLDCSDPKVKHTPCPLTVSACRRCPCSVV